MHLEGVPGLGHRIVQALLNRVTNTAVKEGVASFSFPNPNGARDRTGAIRRTPFIPLVELLGHPHPNLVQDLENGTVSEITLIDGRPRGQLGGNQYLQEKEQSVRVAVDRALPAQNRLPSILAAARTRQANFQRAAIRFKDPAGHPRTLKLDLATGNPEQQTYLESYSVVGINPPMDESTVNIVPFLGDRIKARVVADRT
jgi:hypothetical protein